MEIYDMHLHTAYSFDGRSSLDQIAECAYKQGIAGIAFTDHCDIDCIEFHKSADYGAEYAELRELKERYKGKLRIAFGIELGGRHSAPEAAEELLSRYDFDYVIGSLHNLRNVPDFSNFKYDLMAPGLNLSLWRRALHEYLEMIDLGGFDTLAHLTYPLRYMARCGCKSPIPDTLELIREVLTALAESGIALEINTSGLRDSLGVTMPDLELIKLYRECGGEYITAGSDAHSAELVGSGISQAYELMRAAGFKYATVKFGKEREMIRL